MSTRRPAGAFFAWFGLGPEIDRRPECEQPECWTASRAGSTLCEKHHQLAYPPQPQPVDPAPIRVRPPEPTQEGHRPGVQLKGCYCLRCQRIRQARNIGQNRRRRIHAATTGHAGNCTCSDCRALRAAVNERGRR